MSILVISAERIPSMTYEELREEIKEANLVLVGLGEELSGASEVF